MPARVTESAVEQAALDWLTGMGYEMAHGPDISPGGDRPERSHDGDVVLVRRLRGSLEWINPDLPTEALDEAMRNALQTESASLVEHNRRFHRLLTDGVKVPSRVRKIRGKLNVPRERLWETSAGYYRTIQVA